MLMIDLPEAKYFLPTSSEQEEILLVVIGGRQPKQNWLNKVPAWQTVCADKGGRYASLAGRKIELLVGDEDSAGPDLFSDIENKGGRVLRHPCDKDDTDLQLLLNEVIVNPKHLVVAGAFGGRLDHLQSNIRSLLAYKFKTGKQVLLADGKEAMALLGPGEICIADIKNEKLPVVSVLALAENSVATMDHVKWPMEKMKLNLLHPNTLSNKPLDHEMWAQCDEGKIGFYLCFDEADL